MLVYIVMSSHLKKHLPVFQRVSSCPTRTAIILHEHLLYRLECIHKIKHESALRIATISCTSIYFGCVPSVSQSLDASHCADRPTNTAGVASTEPRVPSRFKRVLDKATGRHYYYDKETRETFWTLTEGPGGVPLNVSHEDPRRRRKSKHDMYGG